MFVIVGLGNPDKKYEHTRHNIGFDVVDALAAKYNIDIKDKKHKALCGTGVIEGMKVLLVKPQTFMNLSGESLRPIMDFYKLEPEDFIIIHDDIDLDVGRLRIRRKGSAGGHNGLKSIINHLGSMDFPRVKIGVGEKPKGYDLADYVLGHFTKQEQAIFAERFDEVYDAVQLIVMGDITEAMNRHNKKKKTTEVLFWCQDVRIRLNGILQV